MKKYALLFKTPLGAQTWSGGVFDSRKDANKTGEKIARSKGWNYVGACSDKELLK